MADDKKIKGEKRRRLRGCSRFYFSGCPRVSSYHQNCSCIYNKKSIGSLFRRSIKASTNTRKDCTEIEEDLGVHPDEVKWEANTLSGSNKVQLDQKITIIAEQEYDIGNFGPFGSFSVDLTGKASGKSEVYWKN